MSKTFALIDKIRKIGKTEVLWSWNINDFFNTFRRHKIHSFKHGNLFFTRCWRDLRCFVSKLFSNCLRHVKVGSKLQNTSPKLSSTQIRRISLTSVPWQLRVEIVYSLRRGTFLFARIPSHNAHVFNMFYSKSGFPLRLTANAMKSFHDSCSFWTSTNFHNKNIYDEMPLYRREKGQGEGEARWTAGNKDLARSALIVSVLIPWVFPEKLSLKLQKKPFHFQVVQVHKLECFPLKLSSLVVILRCSSKLASALFS